MGKKEKELKTNVILTEGLWEKSKIRAAKDRITLSELVRRSLKEHLAKKEPGKKEDSHRSDEKFDPFAPPKPGSKMGRFDRGD